MNAIQYDLFLSQEESEIECLRKEVAELKKSLDKQRRALFARHGEHTKIINDLSDRLYLLERNICLGKIEI